MLCSGMEWGPSAEIRSSSPPPQPSGISLVSFAFPVSRELAEEIGWWADFPLLALTILCAWLASRAESATWGRRFWKSSRSASRSGSGPARLAVLLGRRLPFEGEVLNDSLFLGYYFGLLLATAVKPHERGAPTRSRRSC